MPIEAMTRNRVPISSLPRQVKAKRPEYPRVLIVYHSCINKEDSNTVSLRNWFAEWPKDCLAQIYSGNDVGNERFCGNTFRLGIHERLFGKLFFRLKESSFGEASRPMILGRNRSTMPAGGNNGQSLKHRLGAWMTGTGLWELMFPPVLSPRMMTWIESFKPDIIYVQGYHLAFAWLAVALHRRCGLPVCYHAVDDWPRFLYADSIVSWFVRPFVQRSARKLIGASAVTFAIGDRMAAEYQTKYGVEIRSLMVCDHLQRYKAANPRRLVRDDCICILYSGGLGHDRWKSLVDLSVAGQLLGKQGIDVRITAFTSLIPAEAADTLQGLSNVHFEPLPSHEKLPGILKGADILFLPETFDPGEADVIRLSVSTKAPLYMMSEKPILVYGSPTSGVVDYAKKSGWGYVVEKQDAGLLAGAIKELQKNETLKRELVARGLTVAEQNHEASFVRQKLRLGMLHVVQERKVSRGNS